MGRSGSYSNLNMEFKINTKKRIQIHATDLWPIKRAYYNDEVWFEVFVKNFAVDSGLEKTSVRTKRVYFNGKRTTKAVYYFKIVDKKKWMLNKLKHGI